MNQTNSLKFLHQIFNENEIIIDQTIINNELNNCINIIRDILCIVKPINKKQVIALVQECQKNKISLYTYSTWNNWWYGSKNPVINWSILLDLSQMNKIINVDNILCSVEIQPWVTQWYLAEYLNEKKIDLMVNATWAGPWCSIIWNALEKWFWVGLYNENFEAILDMEIILPNWDILKTWYEHFANTKLQHIRPSWIGPDIKWLFAQSNMWIVVSATFKLQRNPKYKELLLISCKNDDSAFKLIDELRELKNNWVITNTVQLFNKNRVISTLEWKPSLDQKQMDTKDIEKYTKQYNLQKWNWATLICWTKGMIQAKKKEINKTLKKQGYWVQYYNEDKINLLKKISPIMSFIKWYDTLTLLKSLHETYNFYCWKPYNQWLNSCYYRNKQSPKIYNPAKENCGIYWISPITPLISENEREVYNIIETWFKKYEFDLFITINVINERQITNVVGLTYNKDNKEESKRAFICHEEVINNLLQSWYLPYRLWIWDMDKFINKDEIYWKKILDLKKILDPNMILSPWRYCINEK
jgi:4-cresol dehydrogenase (hydroxylating) flavoprotein subunit